MTLVTRELGMTFGKTFSVPIRIVHLEFGVNFVSTGKKASS
jgi:hypothetical protein